MKVKSEWRDLNPRPSVPKTDALARLRHTPYRWHCCVRFFICQGLLHYLHNMKLFCIIFIARRGARLLDEVERSGARRLQTVRAWPRAAQHRIFQ